MNNEEVAMDVAMNFYENKNVEMFLAEAEARNVLVDVYEERKDEYVDYIVGGVVHAVIFTKPGKKTSVTIRPVV
jgi:hypothetical protein